MTAAREPWRCGYCGAHVPAGLPCSTCVAPLSARVLGCRSCGWRAQVMTGEEDVEEAAHRDEFGHRLTWHVAGIPAGPLWD